MKQKKIFSFHSDINECLINNGGCHSDAICTNTPGSFSCSCKSGYQGNGLNCLGIFFFLFPYYLFLYLFELFQRIKQKKFFFI